MFDARRFELFREAIQAAAADLGYKVVDVQIQDDFRDPPVCIKFTVEQGPRKSARLEPLSIALDHPVFQEAN